MVLLKINPVSLIKEAALSLNLGPVGVAGAAPPQGLETILKRRLEEGRCSPFEEQEILPRLHPELLLEGCRSILVLAMPYPSPREDSPVFAPPPRGRVARFARGLDYHLLLQERAERLLELLRREYPSLRARILVDRNPLVERRLARQAGLGWIGKNCNLIVPPYGSFVALGTVLLNLPLEEDSPAAGECGPCRRCLEACPTGALEAPFILNPYRCLSYITQASGIVPRDYRPLMGNLLYGCDRCQEVCPHNREAAFPDPPYSFGFFPAETPLKPLLRMNKQEFKQTVGLTAAGWRGLATLQRNAVIALGNSGDREAVPILASLLHNDPRPGLKVHAAWALGRLGGREARRSLEQSCRKETETLLREELRLALELT
ncbi:MAG: tRNA epoxyqueuosine(34) reductase QueG [Dethiobacteria bacterium]|nr:tRNA epoxyqueuosine(34) reductase QueG [Bacillota bacterium]HOP68563.1 tRNA epoxyqueuosine(34) reductase QueG [Bacillota bacterium]HQD05305.1 tRNA epoxyqueuosine(34) reductase QueG [Bacillota bacterium]